MPLQQTDDWRQARVGRATASRFSDIMATIRSGESASRKNYRAELVTERLTGKPTESFTSSAMQWGIDTEPLAKLRYTLKTRNILEDSTFMPHTKLMAGASPDGHLVGQNGGVEVKCPNTAQHIEVLHTQALPNQYRAQVQGQMWITGWDFVDFISFDPRLPDNANLVVVRIARDDAYIKALETEIKRFLKEVDAEVQFVSGYGKTPAMSAVIGPDEVAKFRLPDAQGDDSSL